MPKITPLLRFLRAMTVDQRKQFADECETTMVYLYQLAAQPFPNPRLRLAMALVDASKRWRRKLATEPLTFYDLLVGTADEGSVPAAGSD